MACWSLKVPPRQAFRLTSSPSFSVSRHLLCTCPRDPDCLCPCIPPIAILITGSTLSRTVTPTSDYPSAHLSERRKKHKEEPPDSFHIQRVESHARISPNWINWESPTNHAYFSSHYLLTLISTCLSASSAAAPSLPCLPSRLMPDLAPQQLRLLPRVGHHLPRSPLSYPTCKGPQPASGAAPSPPQLHSRECERESEASSSPGSEPACLPPLTAAPPS